MAHEQHHARNQILDESLDLEPVNVPFKDPQSKRLWYTTSREEAYTVGDAFSTRALDLADAQNPKSRARTVLAAERARIALRKSVLASTALSWDQRSYDIAKIAQAERLSAASRSGSENAYRADVGEPPRLTYAADQLVYYESKVPVFSLSEDVAKDPAGHPEAWTEVVRGTTACGTRLAANACSETSRFVSESEVSPAARLAADQTSN